MFCYRPPATNKVFTPARLNGFSLPSNLDVARAELYGLFHGKVDWIMIGFSQYTPKRENTSSGLAANYPWILR